MKKYRIPDVASILKATTTVGSRALKPSTRAAKYVRKKLVCLSKDHVEKCDEEAVQKVDKGKGRMEEPQKKKKLSHSSSSSEKSSTTIVSAAKQAVPLSSKLMEASMKTIKVEACSEGQ